MKQTGLSLNAISYQVDQTKRKNTICPLLVLFLSVKALYLRYLNTNKFATRLNAIASGLISEMKADLTKTTLYIFCILSSVGPID